MYYGSSTTKSAFLALFSKKIDHKKPLKITKRKNHHFLPKITHPKKYSKIQIEILSKKNTPKKVLKNTN